MLREKFGSGDQLSLAIIEQRRKEEVERTERDKRELMAKAKEDARSEMEAELQRSEAARVEDKKEISALREQLKTASRDWEAKEAKLSAALNEQNAKWTVATSTYEQQVRSQFYPLINIDHTRQSVQVAEMESALASSEKSREALTQALAELRAALRRSEEEKRKSLAVAVLPPAPNVRGVCLMFPNVML